MIDAFDYVKKYEEETHNEEVTINAGRGISFVVFVGHCNFEIYNSDFNKAWHWELLRKARYMRSMGYSRHQPIYGFTCIRENRNHDKYHSTVGGTYYGWSPYNPTYRIKTSHRVSNGRGNNFYVVEGTTVIYRHGMKKVVYTSYADIEDLRAAGAEILNKYNRVLLSRYV